MDDPARPNQTLNAWQATGFVWEVFAAIAVPTILCALAGRWLDRRYATSPLFVILFLALALGISGLLVYRKARSYVEKTSTKKL